MTFVINNYRKVVAVFFALLMTMGLMLTAYLNVSQKNSGINVAALDMFTGNYKFDPCNILLVGLDAVGANTDTIMVLNVNPLTSELSVISIPRDTYISYKSWSGRINAVFANFGSKGLMEVVENLLDINIKNYVKVELKVFKKIIDDVGGIEFDIPVRMFYTDPSQNLYINLEPGIQHIDGDKAEQLMRFRKWDIIGAKNAPPKPANFSEYYDGSDLKRMDIQQNFMKALIVQKFNFANLNKLTGVLNSVFDSIATDLMLEDIVKIGSGFVTKFDVNHKINSFKIQTPNYVAKGSSASYVKYDNKVLDTTNLDAKGNPAIVSAAQIFPKYFVCTQTFTGATAGSRSLKTSTSTTPEPSSNNRTVKNVPISTPQNNIKQPDDPSSTKLPATSSSPENHPIATMPQPTKAPVQTAKPIST